MMGNDRDWHTADIKAAVEKKGLNFEAIGRNNGVSGATIREAFRKPYPKSERAIAAAIGVEPSVIWPTRYINKCV